MKNLYVCLLLALLSLKSYSQNDFVYKNIEYGLEITFPAKFTSREMKPAGSITQNLSTCIIMSAGLSYSALIQKSTVEVDMVSAMQKMGDVVINSKYKIGGKDVTEFTYSTGGSYARYKIINLKHVLIMLTVASEASPKDKDVFPFFNSLKIDHVSYQDPYNDNSKFSHYAIENLSLTKTDTIRQIVYVNSNANANNAYQFLKLSDVDNKIPQNTSTNPYRFALIIGNEDYSSHQVDLKNESNVEFAKNDASAFKEYCINTLGIPEKNITFLLDATYGQINQGIAKLNLLSKACSGKSQLIFYYAGHGLPDEVTKAPYLIPVDVNGANAASGIKLQDLYKSLTEFPSERVTVFLDACFTGGGRNSGLIASRGVKIKPKENMLNGNIVVLSSSSGEQSSLPYPDNKHGMFTYFLLKKLQETNGDLTYFELFKSLKESISVESLLVNSKEQNPQLNYSPAIDGTWASWKVK